MTEPVSSRLPLWLIISLIVNALLIGLVIGGGLHSKRYPERTYTQQPFSRGLPDNLPDADRAVVRDVFRTAARHSREERESVRLARRELATALNREPYDRDEVVQAFERLRSADMAVRQRLHEDLANRLEGLSPDQRRAILYTLDRRDRRDRRHGGHPRRQPAEQPPPTPIDEN